MYRTIIRIGLVGLISISAVTNANAVARNFFAPGNLGDRIAFCSPTNEVCGKPIADAWCEKNGFEKSILFQRDRRKLSNSTSLVRYAENGKVCTDDQCVSFAQIKCFSSDYD